MAEPHLTAPQTCLSILKTDVALWSDEDLGYVASFLRNSGIPVLQSLSFRELMAVAVFLRPLSVLGGTNLISESSSTVDKLIVLVSGRVTLTDVAALAKLHSEAFDIDDVDESSARRHLFGDTETVNIVCSFHTSPEHGETRAISALTEDSCDLFTLDQADFDLIRRRYAGRVLASQAMTKYNFFASMSQAMLIKLGVFCEPRAIASHVMVVAQNSSQDSVYFLVEGQCVLLRTVTVEQDGFKESKQMPLVSIGPGQVFGEQAVLSKSSTHYYNVKATSNLRLYELNVDPIYKFVRGYNLQALRLRVTSSVRWRMDRVAQVEAEVLKLQPLLFSSSRHRSNLVSRSCQPLSARSSRSPSRAHKVKERVSEAKNRTQHHGVYAKLRSEAAFKQKLLQQRCLVPLRPKLAPLPRKSDQILSTRIGDDGYDYELSNKPGQPYRSDRLSVQARREVRRSVKIFHTRQTARKPSSPKLTVSMDAVVSQDPVAAITERAEYGQKNTSRYGFQPKIYDRHTALEKIEARRRFLKKIHGERRHVPYNAPNGAGAYVKQSRNIEVGNFEAYKMPFNSAFRTFVNTVRQPHDPNFWAQTARS